MTRTLFCAAILVCGVDSALGQTSFSNPRSDSSNAEIERLLDQKRDMVFNDATIEDLAGFLTSNGMPTYIDKRALDEIGVGTDTPLAFWQNGIRLRDGLKLALQPLDLSFTVRDGILVITTLEREEEQLITKVYDVRNLVELVPVPYWGGGLGGGPAKIAYQYDFDSLIETVTSTVGPNSWDEVGGPASIEPYYTRRMRVIVVAQTYDHHRQLQALLNELAEHGGKTPLPSPTIQSVPSQQPSTLVRSPTRSVSRTSAGIRSSQLRTTGQ